MKFVFVILLALLSHLEEIQSAKPVYFSLIVSYGEFGFNSSGAIPSIDIALRYVNNKSQLLPEYELRYNTVRNSKCTRGESLNAFFEDFQFSPDTKIAVIGCGCSSATEPVAEISHQWNIPQISFAAAVSSLTDRNRFRNYFRTTPNFKNSAPALLAILNKFHWRRIAFLTENQGIFLKVHSDFHQLLNDVQSGQTDTCCFEHSNITTDFVGFDTTGDVVAASQDLFNAKKFHVFFLNCYSEHARKLICEAARRDLSYPHYAWIIFDEYPERWWTEEVAKKPIEGCSDEMLEDFLVKARPLLIRLLPEPDDEDTVTAAGISAKTFMELYENERNISMFEASSVHSIAFDATWALAEALHHMEHLRKNKSLNFEAIANFTGCGDSQGELVPLNEFNYSNAFMGCVLKYSLHQTDFLGVSGPVQFGDDGTIIYTKIWMVQMRLNENGMIEKKRFGYIDRASNYQTMYEDGESDETLFPDGYPPDGTPIEIIHSYKIGLTILYYLTAVAGLVLAIACALFNFIFRSKKVIRLTSPQLNYVIILGAVFMYISVFFQLAPTTEKNVFHFLCIIHTWFYCVGYLLVYGTILAKMWRIYYIFHNPTPQKMVVKASYLFFGVFCVTGLGAVLVLIKTIILALSPPQLLSDSENPTATTENDIHEDYSVWMCYEIGSAPFFFDLLIFIYLALLQIVGIILAFQTRKVKIRVLNDSKFVAALIYISSIVLVIIVLVTFILRSYINISAGIFSGGIIILATIFLILIFLPKMINLYQDPDGENVFKHSNPTTKREKNENSLSNSLPANLSELTDGEKVSLLQEKIIEMKKEIKEKTKRIDELEKCFQH